MFRCTDVIRLALALVALSLASPVWSQAAGARSSVPELHQIAQAARESQSDAILVMRNGEILLEAYLPGGDEPMELMSVTKSIVALAIGALLQDGLLSSLDEPVHHFFPEWKQGRKSLITVRMLMDHTSGLQNVLMPAEEIYPAPDVVKLALAAELSHEPGSHAAYNNKAVNLLAGIVHQAAGERMDGYIQRRILDPLGVQTGDWYTDSAGNPHAMAGAHLDARALAAIGQLVLDKGVHDGRQIVPPGFIDEMLAPSRLSREMGLLWTRRVAWVRFHADEASLERIESAGVAPDFLDALRPLKGRSFESADILYGALAEVLGPTWFERWHRELIAEHGIGPWAPFHPQQGPVEAYEATGSMGQSLVVVPKAGLVAVRQIRARDDHSAANSYPQFLQHVQALADAL